MDDGVGFTGAGSAQGGTAPTIWGDPQRSVLVGANYVYQPEAEDADGDVLEFSIENKPSWALFDPASGTLQGVPAARDVGQHGNIVISVSDSNSIVSLASFSIRVRDMSTPDDGGTGGTDGSPSAPPTISGEPNTSAVVGSQYVFRPEVSDPDGDELSFSIVNKPLWANFNTTKGRLGGFPESSDIGTSKPIEISVTDGSSVVALERFTITVEPVGTASLTLRWNAPTQNVDGSPLTDLAGYRIYYGTASGDYTETIEINSAGVTSYMLEHLAPGRYFLAMTSVNADALESDYSAEVRIDAGG
jgi:hypothetical protein